jgi:hypothetical protein
MDEKQKALAMRWYLKSVSKNPAGAHVKEPEIYLSGPIDDGRLNRTLIHYYGRLNKREMFVCIEILYYIWDSGDGYYDHIEESLVKEHKRLFATRRKVYSTIQRLVDKGIVKCKIYFRESHTDGLHKPMRMLRLCKDIEIAIMPFFRGLKKKMPSSDEPWRTCGCGREFTTKASFNRHLRQVEEDGILEEELREEEEQQAEWMV